MLGARIHIGTILIALALLLRIIVPAGFMPTGDKRFAIMLCTGEGAATAWIDEDGNIQKGEPETDSHGDQPCLFSGLGTVLDLPGAAVAVMPSLVLAGIGLARLSEAAIGQGLAAPPPPSTGPPLLP